MDEIDVIESVTDPDSALVAAAALNADCQFDAADRLLQQAADRFPRNAAVLAQWVALTAKRGDWRGAAERIAAMQERFELKPEQLDIAFRAQLHFDRFAEADEVRRRAQMRYPAALFPLRFAAQLAEARQDFDQAARCWGTIRLKFPDSAVGWTAAAACDRKLARYEAAEDLLRAAVQKFTTNAGVHIAFAAVAEEIGNWPEADRRWAEAVARFPENRTAALLFALSRRRKRILDAMGAEVRNLPEAEETFSRLDWLHVKFPHFGEGYARHIELLWRFERIDTARVLAARAARLLPDDAAVGAQVARLEEHLGQPEDSVNRLLALTSRVPNDERIPVALAQTLSRLGRFDDAEAVCKRAIERFRFKMGPFREYADVAMRRENWSSAIERLQEAARIAPRDPVISTSLSLARLALAASDAVDATTAEVVGASDLSEGPLAALMMQFESLGGPSPGGCEFGQVQRRFGAEPLGLLRWSSISIQQLTRALECRFEGVGTAPYSRLEVNGDLSPAEYYFHDVRFGIATHTRVKEGEAPFDQLFGQMCRRTIFLRRKLLEELESGRKIFVYTPALAPPSSEDIKALHIALRKAGGSWLLVLCQANDQHKAGAVEVVGAGLMIGYLNHYFVSSSGELVKPDMHCWMRILIETYKLSGLGDSAVMDHQFGDLDDGARE